MEVRPPERLRELLALVMWKPTKQSGQPDIRLDKGVAKENFDKKTLRECAFFLLGASHETLREQFLPYLDDTWRTAMAPDSENERIEYLASQVMP